MYNWRDLPFREIWCVDTEFYPGRGFANGGRAGDRLTPLCLVGIEMRSERIIRLWQDELCPFPPYFIDRNALFLSYLLTAEFGFHIACGWGQPACAVDPYVEYRHYTNDGSIRSSGDKAGKGKREKDFFSLAGALRFFGEDELDSTHKKDMRDRILRGPPFTISERADILRYCEDDVRALTRLVPHTFATLRSLPEALFRGKYEWALAQQEWRGLPIDLPKLQQIQSRWDEMKCEIVLEKDKAFGIYEIEHGVPHWREHRFADYIKRNGMAWPTYPSGALDEADEAFKTMEGRYPAVRELRQLRSTISKLKLNKLQVGNDARNRVLLSPYATKTARNGPSSTGYAFGPAKWVRFLIMPPPGRVLIHRDYTQQEVYIAAIISSDRTLLEACLTGDVYLGVAKQLGLAPADATPETHPAVRALFKSVVLGILYGLGPHTLAMQTGISLYEAAELLARLRARFHVFEDFVRCALDRAGLTGEICTPFGWTMQCPPEINPRTIRNFPVQSTAAEILHVACILADRRRLEIVAPIHDALIAETSLDRADEISEALAKVMADASRVVLRDFELRTDMKIIHPGEHFFDKGGAEMWSTVERLLTKLETRSA